jgi:hypothetical protein
MTGAHIWADRSTVRSTTFSVRDQVASSVVGAIEPKLRQSEIERAGQTTESRDAYDFYLRARAFQKLAAESREAVRSQDRRWHRPLRPSGSIDRLYLVAASQGLVR